MKVVISTHLKGSPKSKSPSGKSRVIQIESSLFLQSSHTEEKSREFRISFELFATIEKRNQKAKTGEYQFSKKSLFLPVYDLF